MKKFHSVVLICSSLLTTACTAPQPKLVGDNQTGAALIATPSTFGATTITTVGQRACTEPRPNASLDTAVFAKANLSAEQIAAIVSPEIGGEGGGGTKIGASAEFESVEFLAHGLFGICQLVGSGALTEAQAKDLIPELITTAATLQKGGK